MTNELGTTLADLEEQAKKKEEALKTLHRLVYLGEFCIMRYAPNDRWREGFQKDAQTIRDYIEGKV